VDGEPFGEEHPESWQNFYNDPVHRSHVVQMVGCGKEFSRLATEFTLIDLYWFARGSGNQNQPKVVVLDEIQNLDHSQNGPIAGFLTEGRKFGISLILATQTLSNLHSEEKDRLFQASHKLFFKPAETEIKEYAKILEHTKGEKSDIWIERLSGLNKGECYSLGPSLNPATGELEDKAFKIKITSLGERILRQE
jgi:DNA phosphorothioation-dependent restriction protein DptH